MLPCCHRTQYGIDSPNSVPATMKVQSSTSAYPTASKPPIAWPGCSALSGKRSSRGAQGLWRLAASLECKQRHMPNTMSHQSPPYPSVLVPEPITSTYNNFRAGSSLLLRHTTQLVCIRDRKAVLGHLAALCGLHTSLLRVLPSGVIQRALPVLSLYQLLPC